MATLCRPCSEGWRQCHLRRIGYQNAASDVVDVIHFYKTVTLIGRKRDTVDCFLCYDPTGRSGYISRIHARVIRTVNSYELVDSSLTGVYVNDVQISGRVVLQEGDTVTFGHPAVKNINPKARIRQPNSPFYFLFERCHCSMDQMRGRCGEGGAVPQEFPVLASAAASLLVKRHVGLGKSAALPAVLSLATHAQPVVSPGHVDLPASSVNHGCRCPAASAPTLLQTSAISGPPPVTSLLPINYVNVASRSPEVPSEGRQAARPVSVLEGALWPVSQPLRSTSPEYTHAGEAPLVPEGSSPQRTLEMTRASSFGGSPGSRGSQSRSGSKAHAAGCLPARLGQLLHENCKNDTGARQLDAGCPGSVDFSLSAPTRLRGSVEADDEDAFQTEDSGGLDCRLLAAGAEEPVPGSSDCGEEMSEMDIDQNSPEAAECGMPLGFEPDVQAQAAEAAREVVAAAVCSTGHRMEEEGPVEAGRIPEQHTENFMAKPFSETVSLETGWAADRSLTRATDSLVAEERELPAGESANSTHDSVSSAPGDFSWDEEPGGDSSTEKSNSDTSFRTRSPPCETQSDGGDVCETSLQERTSDGESDVESHSESPSDAGFITDCHVSPLDSVSPEPELGCLCSEGESSIASSLEETTYAEVGTQTESMKERELSLAMAESGKEAETNGIMDVFDCDNGLEASVAQQVSLPDIGECAEEDVPQEREVEPVAPSGTTQQDLSSEDPLETCTEQRASPVDSVWVEEMTPEEPLEAAIPERLNDVYGKSFDEHLSQRSETPFGGRMEGKVVAAQGRLEDGSMRCAEADGGPESFIAHPTPEAEEEASSSAGPAQGGLCALVGVSLAEGQPGSASGSENKHQGEADSDGTLEEGERATEEGRSCIASATAEGAASQLRTAEEGGPERGQTPLAEQESVGCGPAEGAFAGSREGDEAQSHLQLCGDYLEEGAVLPSADSSAGRQSSSQTGKEEIVGGLESGNAHLLPHQGSTEDDGGIDLRGAIAMKAQVDSVSARPRAGAALDEKDLERSGAGGRQVDDEHQGTLSDRSALLRCQQESLAPGSHAAELQQLETRQADFEKPLPYHAGSPVENNTQEEVCEAGVTFEHLIPPVPEGCRKESLVLEEGGGFGQTRGRSHCREAGSCHSLDPGGADLGEAGAVQGNAARNLPSETLMDLPGAPELCSGDELDLYISDSEAEREEIDCSRIHGVSSSGRILAGRALVMHLGRNAEKSEACRGLAEDSSVQGPCDAAVQEAGAGALKARNGMGVSLQQQGMARREVSPCAAVGEELEGQVAGDAKSVSVSLACVSAESPCQPESDLELGVEGQAPRRMGGLAGNTGSDLAQDSSLMDGRLSGEVGAGISAPPLEFGGMSVTPPSSCFLGKDDRVPGTDGGAPGRPQQELKAVRPQGCAFQLGDGPDSSAGFSEGLESSESLRAFSLQEEASKGSRKRHFSKDGALGTSDSEDGSSFQKRLCPLDSGSGLCAPIVAPSRLLATERHCDQLGRATGKLLDECSSRLILHRDEAEQGNESIIARLVRDYFKTKPCTDQLVAADISPGILAVPPDTAGDVDCKSVAVLDTEERAICDDEAKSPPTPVCDDEAKSPPTPVCDDEANSPPTPVCDDEANSPPTPVCDDEANSPPTPVCDDEANSPPTPVCDDEANSPPTPVCDDEANSPPTPVCDDEAKSPSTPVCDDEANSPPTPVCDDEANSPSTPVCDDEANSPSTPNTEDQVKEVLSQDSSQDGQHSSGSALSAASGSPTREQDAGSPLRCSLRSLCEDYCAAEEEFQSGLCSWLQSSPLKSPGRSPGAEGEQAAGENNLDSLFSDSSSRSAESDPFEPSPRWCRGSSPGRLSREASYSDDKAVEVDVVSGSSRDASIASDVGWRDEDQCVPSRMPVQSRRRSENDSAGSLGTAAEEEDLVVQQRGGTLDGSDGSSRKSKSEQTVSCADSSHSETREELDDGPGKRGSLFSEFLQRSEAGSPCPEMECPQPPLDGPSASSLQEQGTPHFGTRADCSHVPLKREPSWEDREDEGSGSPSPSEAAPMASKLASSPAAGGPRSVGSASQSSCSGLAPACNQAKRSLSLNEPCFLHPTKRDGSLKAVDVEASGRLPNGEGGPSLFSSPSPSSDAGGTAGVPGNPGEQDIGEGLESDLRGSEGVAGGVQQGDSSSILQAAAGQMAESGALLVASLSDNRRLACSPLGSEDSASTPALGQAAGSPSPCPPRAFKEEEDLCESHGQLDGPPHHVASPVARSPVVSVLCEPSARVPAASASRRLSSPARPVCLQHKDTRLLPDPLDEAGMPGQLDHEGVSSSDEFAPCPPQKSSREGLPSASRAGLWPAGEGSACTTTRSSSAPKEWASSEQDIEFQLRECQSALGELSQSLCAVEGVDSVHLEKWREQVADLQKATKMPQTYIAVVGNTGAGKSCLLNALLDEEAVLPTSAMRACTAVVVEISRAAGGHPYEADVEFLSREEWYKELQALLEDMKDKSGNLKKRCPDRKTEAGAAYSRVKAVYGKVDELAKLEEMQEVTQHLGTVERIVAETATDFRANIERFIDSRTDNLREMKGGEFWPIVKCVRIRVAKAEVLRTGAVLVDLPGIRDSNAARDNAAKEYLKDCNAVWVVASITRAVDDKTAKEMLSANLRRQLFMDGRYGSLAFVCTKTDSFNVADIVKDLDLRDEIQLLEDDVRALESRKMQAEAEKQHLYARLQQEEQRQGGDAAADSAWLHRRHDFLEKEFIINDLQKQKDAKLRDISLICVQARNKFSKQRISVDFSAGLEEMRRATFSENEDDGDEDMEDGDSSSSEPDDPGETGSQYRKLPVFTVSATEYLKLCGKLLRDGQAQVFHDTKDTEIPALKKFAMDTALKHSMVATEKVARDLARVLSQIVNYLTSRRAQDRSHQAQIQETIQQSLEDVPSLLQEAIDDAVHDMRYYLDVVLLASLSKGVQQAKEQCEDTVKSLGVPDTGYPHSTYHAVCVRRGVYTSPKYGCVDLNSRLAAPIYATIAVTWHDTFSFKLEESMTHFTKAVLDKLKSFFKGLRRKLGKHSRIAGAVHVVYCQEMEAARARLLNFSLDQMAYISRTQRTISRILVPEIQAGLEPAYAACSHMTGPGYFKKIKQVMETYVHQEKSAVFDSAANKLHRQLQLLQQNIHRSFQSLVQELSKSLKMQLEPVLKPIQKNARILPDLMSICAKVDKICKRSCVEYVLPNSSQVEDTSLEMGKEVPGNWDPPSFSAVGVDVQMGAVPLPHITTIQQPTPVAEASPAPSASPRLPEVIRVVQQPGSPRVNWHLYGNKRAGEAVHPLQERKKLKGQAAGSRDPAGGALLRSWTADAKEGPCAQRSTPRPLPTTGQAGVLENYRWKVDPTPGAPQHLTSGKAEAQHFAISSLGAKEEIQRLYPNLNTMEQDQSVKTSSEAPSAATSWRTH